MSTNTDSAKLALSYFHNETLRSWPGNYKLSFDGLVSKINSLSPFFLETFGKAINWSGISQTKVSDAMKQLAISSKGNLPLSSAGLQTFYDALSESVKWDLSDWGSAIVTATKETAVSVGKFSLVSGGVLLLVFVIFAAWRLTK